MPEPFVFLIFCIFKEKIMEFNIRLSNGQVLRGMIKSPGDHIKAVVILIHGQGEHIRRYVHWAGLFNAEGIGFTGVDLPGHGLSDGTRGRIRSYSLLTEMIDVLVSECRKTFPGLPIFLYGHSMGGTILAHYLLKRKPLVRGAIITSPWLKLAFEPPSIEKFLASVLRYIIPGLVMNARLEVPHLSHDPDVVKDYAEDPLVHDRISVGLFHETSSAASSVLFNASKLETPLLLMHGSDDMICSVEGSREFAAKTSVAELKIWDGAFHELHNEPFRDEVFRYIIGWIEKRMGKGVRYEKKGE